MKISRPLAVLGAAGAIALAAPAGPAHADTAPQPRATGTFTYYDVVGGRQTLTDPPSRECLETDGIGFPVPVSNQTDSLAIVFQLPDCVGPAVQVFPGQLRNTPFPRFGSVMFVDVD